MIIESTKFGYAQFKTQLVHVPFPSTTLMFIPSMFFLEYFPFGAEYTAFHNRMS